MARDSEMYTNMIEFQDPMEFSFPNGILILVLETCYCLNKKFSGTEKEGNIDTCQCALKICRNHTGLYRYFLSDVLLSLLFCTYNGDPNQSYVSHKAKKCTKHKELH